MAGFTVISTPCSVIWFVPTAATAVFAGQLGPAAGSEQIPDLLAGSTGNETNVIRRTQKRKNRL